METLTIFAQTREVVGKKTKELRRKGFVPGIVYGPQNKNKIVMIDGRSFKKVFNQAGESTLIDLKVDDKNVGKVIINDYQTDPVTDDITHIDLYQVRMDKKITVNVSLKFIGESPAVKGEGGVLVKNHDKLEIKCLPGDLIHDFEIDLSGLAKIDDTIRIKDLKLPKNIEIAADPEEVVVSIIPPRSEEEMKELESKIEENIDKVESVKEKKEVEEEPVEGEDKEKKEKKDKKE